MGCSPSKTQAGDKAWADGDKEKQAKEERSREKKAAASENRDYKDKMEFLVGVPLMKRLPLDQQPLVATACVAQEFKAGSKVIEQGEKGDAFFVIRKGEASVQVAVDGGAPEKVATLKAGDYFGESALLRDEVRSATITAVTALSTFKITRDKFQELGLHEKLQFANRRAVGAGDKKVMKAKPPTPKTAQEAELITKALRDNENMQTIMTLDDQRIQSFLDVMWKEEVDEGFELIKEGDLNADYFYVVQDGNFEIYVSELDEQETAESLEFVKSVSKGGSFGELALLYFVPRAATVKAKTKSTVWVIDRNNFKEIIMKVSDKKLQEYAKYLDGVSNLQSLLSEEKRELAKALAEMHFTQDELIIQQGEPGNSFYILYEGEVNILKDGQVVTKLKASQAHGSAQYFGEGALLANEVRGATVQVTSSLAKTLVLDRDAFDLLLGPLRDILDQHRTLGKDRQSRAPAGNSQRSSAQDRLQQIPAQHLESRGKILFKDLVRIGLLGRGGFGLVELYEHKVTQETYALKGLSKGYILKAGLQDSVMNEKNILLMTNSDFIVKLYETYNGSQHLYFLMEPALGGELYVTYNRKSFHGSAKHCKFYVAGTIFAFEHLHERRIIYRDLKPENLLLTHEGHLKLTDMGLAKFVIGKTYTTCGTPDYFAPELISTQGHTNAVDWWTLGILIFELMSGAPPFESASPMQIYSKVVKGISKIPFPASCQGDVGDLIRQLLRKEPSERLPMRAGGVQNVKSHKWFESFDWQAAQSLRLEPPYKPIVKSKKDLANFGARKEDPPKQVPYTDPGTGWDENFATVR